MHRKCTLAARGQFVLHDDRGLLLLLLREFIEHVEIVNGGFRLFTECGIRGGGDVIGKRKLREVKIVEGILFFFHC